MTRRMPLYVVAIAALCALSGIFVPPVAEQPGVEAFSRIPVLSEGRFKPLNSLARSSLLEIQGRQMVMTQERVELSPNQWLLDVFFAPEKADGYSVFVVDDPDLQALIGQTEDTISIHYSKKSEQVMALVGFLPSRRRRF